MIFTYLRSLPNWFSSKDIFFNPIGWFRFSTRSRCATNVSRYEKNSWLLGRWLHGRECFWTFNPPIFSWYKNTQVLLLCMNPLICFYVNVIFLFILQMFFFQFLQIWLMVCTQIFPINMKINTNLNYKRALL